MADDFVSYRFSPVNKHLIESLVSPSLHFAHPSTLNDPFDCRIDVRRSFHRAMSSSTDVHRRYLSRFVETPKFFENWEVQLESLGVCSFSRTMNEALLWSHYANDHKGVCLTYRLPESFLREPQFQLAAGGAVDYLPDPVTTWLRQTAIEAMDDHAFVKALALLCLKTKSPAWAYEKEARLVRLETGVVMLRPELLPQVCFGLQTPRADVDLVAKLAHDYCGCRTFVRMVRDDSDFGFAMVSL